MATSSEVAQIIEQLLSGIEEKWSSALVALVGVGIVAMALIQLLKDFLPTRRWFQYWWLKQFWLYVHADAHNLSRVDADRALTQLVGLATAGDRNALFSLPVEQLTGQLNVAAQALLDRPQSYEDLLYIFAHSADKRDIKEILKDRPTEPATLNKYLESRNRVAQQIQRSLDAVQISMGYRWQWILQGLSVVISAGIVFIALAMYGGASFLTGSGLALAIVVSILAGFIAPIARDLVAAIQSLRARAK